MQKIIERDYYGVTFSLDVQHNFELEKEILGLGDGVMVLKPERLRQNIKARLEGGVDLYNTDINDMGLITAARRLDHKGFAILKHGFSQRSVRNINGLLDKHFKEVGKKPYAIRNLLQVIPKLKDSLFSKNIKRIINAVDPKAQLVKAIFFNKTPQDNWYVTWHQDVPINVKKKLAVKGYTGWTKKENVFSVCPPAEVSQNIFTIRIHLDNVDRNNGALRVLPGSHKKRLNDKEIRLITENCIAYDCELPLGGVQLMKPLLLHSSGKTNSQKNRRVIHLEFASIGLDGGLEWAEKITATLAN